MTTPRDQLRSAIIQAIPILDAYIAAKTLAQYTRQLRQYAREYYTQALDDSAWLDKMLTAISEQIGRAWREGMRANGLDPETEFDEEMQAQIDEIITNEQDHVTNLSDLINSQREKDAGMDAIYSRCDMWANRYNDVVDRAKLATAELKDKYEWILGPTERHCHHNEKPGGWGCANLAGVVATAKQWREAGITPKSTMLSCNGFNCECRLEKTDKRRTRGGIPRP